MTETDKEAPPRSVRGITELDYQRWRHHPVSEFFLQYLRDYRADALAGIQAQWLNSGVELATEHELKGRMLALGEITEMPFSAIASFYTQTNAATNRPQEDDEDDGSETAEDDAG